MNPEDKNKDESKEHKIDITVGDDAPESETKADAKAEEKTEEKPKPEKKVKKKPKRESDKEKIRRLEEEIEELKAEELRERAAVINFRRRTEEDKSRIRKYAGQDMAFDLLTVLDYFEASLNFDSSTGQDMNAVIQEVKYTVEELHRLLARHGIVEIKTDIPFDPKIHEAFATDETSDKKPGTILSINRKGYMYKDRVLRSAMVTVVKAKPEPKIETLKDTEENETNGKSDADMDMSQNSEEKSE